MVRKQPHRLDVNFGGDLLAYIQATAAARGVPAAVVAKEAISEARLRDSFIADEVHAAVLALAAALEPDEQYDPVDDPRQDAAVGRLASTLGSLPAAQGVARALTELSVRGVS